MDFTYTEQTLPRAVAWLFESNGYSVTEDVTVQDMVFPLLAKQMAGLGEQQVFIEVTIDQVNMVKHAGLMARLATVRKQVLGSQQVLVSSGGFTDEARDHARMEGILVYTFQELFRQFERTDPYIEHVLGNGDFAESLRDLDEVYEEPNFDDAQGVHRATEWLTRWVGDESEPSRWVVVVGEYGTGKTALTRVLQRRWMSDYREGRLTRLPFRVELRDFSRQFDARGLLHHFLDRNELAHLNISFVESMIANGRVMLILDGYDEMAQFLNVRERRSCLEALTELSGDGVRGILTSRPNYFTEAEELQVFEVLYRNLATRSEIGAAALDKEVLEQEKQVDRMLEQFVIQRAERQLRDLSPDQTFHLVKRRLGDDPAGEKAVTGILSRVFRPESTREHSLSGKPVIVSYLLDVVEELKRDEASGSGGKLTEWQIYELIINKLMLRDWARVKNLPPSDRLEFLRHLAVRLSSESRRSVREAAFRELIEERFPGYLAKQRAAGAADAADALFDDLRSSSTLTRSREPGEYAWQFSHNSLREYLALTFMVSEHQAGRSLPRQIQLTDAMLTFARSMPKETLEGSLAQLAMGWPNRSYSKSLDRILTLLWPALLQNAPAAEDKRDILARIVGPGLDISKSRLSQVDLSADTRPSDLHRLNASETELSGVSFRGARIERSNFSDSIFEACNLSQAVADEASFKRALIMDCDITGIQCAEADFTDLDRDSTAVVKTSRGTQIITGEHLLGHLRAQGAITDDVNPYYVFAVNSDFEVIEKICKVLADGAQHQRRGVQQRGAAERNVPLARKFLEYLFGCGYLTVKGGRSEMISATSSGRQACHQLAVEKKVDDTLGRFLEENLGRPRRAAG
ncbi:NACHT domain-containing protein [Streptomyces sp. NPDC020983]|uniref:NACHT domain-containing protein n=1 Tax=Streptomyces sp. NPDC020983 TaxID=3365106 RepID=UPI0037953204